MTRAKPGVVVFRAERERGRVVYDMLVDGRVRAYGVDADDMVATLRSFRLQPSEVWVEDLFGDRHRVGR